MQQLILLVLIGYISGSIPSGKLLGLARGIDIQKRGSGNIGFANAVRVLGWPLGLCVLFFDVTKGALPVLLAGQYVDERAQLLVGLAAIFGHIYPLWLKFHGGKGVATGLGVLLALNPPVALLGFAGYCLVFAFTRVSGLASVAGSWLLLPASWLLDPSLFWFCCLLALLASYTHRENLHFHYKQMAKKQL